MKTLLPLMAVFIQGLGVASFEVLTGDYPFQYTISFIPDKAQNDLSITCSQQLVVNGSLTPFSRSTKLNVQSKSHCGMFTFSVLVPSVKGHSMTSPPPCHVLAYHVSVHVLQQVLVPSVARRDSGDHVSTQWVIKLLTPALTTSVQLQIAE